MLLATSNDETASIWNVPSDITWPSTPHVTFKGHTDCVRRGAFLGDESHVITGSDDKSLRIWRASDGVQTAHYQCGESVCVSIVSFLLTFVAMQVYSLSYHAASGNITVGLGYGLVELWQTDPHIASYTAPQAVLPAHECVRERLAEAQALVKDTQASLDKADDGLCQRMSREQELKRSIADLEAKCAHGVSCGQCTD